MFVLKCGPLFVGVEARLLELARPRCVLDLFIAPPDETPSYVLREVAAAELGDSKLPLEGADPSLGEYVVRDNAVLVNLPEEPFAAEAALKALFALAVHRLGGLLLHASAVRWGKHAVAATGPSGAGKSTFARLCVMAGASILSDETMAFLPDGTCFGGPFRSDDDFIPTPELATCLRLFSLVKGETEAVAPLEAKTGVQRILDQAYRPAKGEVPAAQLLGRAAALTSRPGVSRLTFRKHPDAGAFMARWTTHATAAL